MSIAPTTAACITKYVKDDNFSLADAYECVEKANPQPIGVIYLPGISEGGAAASSIATSMVARVSGAVLAWLGIGAVADSSGGCGGECITNLPAGCEMPELKIKYSFNYSNQEQARLKASLISILSAINPCLTLSVKEFEIMPNQLLGDSCDSPYEEGTEPGGCYHSDGDIVLGSHGWSILGNGNNVSLDTHMVLHEVCHAVDDRMLEQEESYCEGAATFRSTVECEENSRDWYGNCKEAFADACATLLESPYLFKQYYTEEQSRILRAVLSVPDDYATIWDNVWKGTFSERLVDRIAFYLQYLQLAPEYDYSREHVSDTIKNVFNVTYYEIGLAEIDSVIETFGNNPHFASYMPFALKGKADRLLKVSHQPATAQAVYLQIISAYSNLVDDEFYAEIFADIYLNIAETYWHSRDSDRYALALQYCQLDINQNGENARAHLQMGRTYQYWADLFDRGQISETAYITYLESAAAEAERALALAGQGEERIEQAALEVRFSSYSRLSDVDDRYIPLAIAAYQDYIDFCSSQDATCPYVSFAQAEIERLQAPL